MSRIVRPIPGGILIGVAVAIATTGAASAQNLIPYSSPAIRGKVLAQETGNPLAGVHVVVFWEGHTAAPPLYPHTLKVVEATSSADGTFVVPAWEPSLLPAPVSADSPGLLAYTPGYEPELVKLGRSVRGDAVEEIRLHRFERPLDTRAQTLSQVAWKLAYLMAPLSGQPKPEMLAAAEAEWQHLPEDALPEKAKGKGLRLSTLFDWWVEEFRRALEYRALEK